MGADRSPVAAQFGRNLGSHRRQARVSQETLAFRAGLHRTEIGMLERGERLPRIDTLIKLAIALSVPPGELLAGIRPPPIADKGAPGFLLPDETVET